MFRIEQSAREVMLRDAISSFPDECCGFMFGKEAAGIRTISFAMAVNNAFENDKRRRFEITPMDYMKAEKYADDHNLLLLGIYHSHPNHPSLPSEHDRVSAQPYFSYVIISIMEKVFASIQSWRLNEAARFEEEEIAYVLTGMNV